MLVEVKEPRSLGDYMVMPEMPSVYLIYDDGKELKLPLGCEALHERIKFAPFSIKEKIDVAKVSIVGAGMLGNPGIAARMFKALSDANINIDVISTSEISISCLIKADKIKEAVNAIHDEFFKD